MSDQPTIATGPPPIERTFIGFTPLADAAQLLTGNLLFWCGIAAIAMLSGGILGWLGTLISSFIAFGKPFPPADANLNLSYRLVAAAVGVALGALLAVVGAGAQSIALDGFRGKKMKFDDLLAGFDRFGSLFMTGITCGLLYWIPLLGVTRPTLLTISISWLWLLLLSAAFSLVPLLVLEHRMKFHAAMLASIRTLGVANTLMLTFLLVLCMVLMSLSVLACFIGLLATAPLLAILPAAVYCRTYRMPSATSPAPAPPLSG